MRAVIAIAAAFTATFAPSAAADSKTGFAFGRTGGSIRPFTLVVATSGRVTATGPAPTHAARVTKEELATLNRVAFEIDFARLPAVRSCPNTLPDVAAQFIRVGGRTVRIHGSCSPRFNRLWAALNRTVVD